MTRCFLASGRHGRPIEVFSTEDTCYECRSEKKCLVFDSSGQEYSEVVFCIDCLKMFNDGRVSSSSWSNDPSGG